MPSVSVCCTTRPCGPSLSARVLPRNPIAAASRASIDGALGTLFTLTKEQGFTANLHIDFRTPVPLPSSLLLVASVDRRAGRKRWISGRLTELALQEEEGEGCRPAVPPDAALFAEAESLFLTRR